MSERRACRKAALTALFLVLMTTVAAADDAKHWRQDCDSDTAHRKETAEPERHATKNEQHVYFRPFCRRARYVTNRSAPCWE